MEQKFWLYPQDKLALLFSIMRELASDDSQIIFEGNLDIFNFNNIELYSKTNDLNNNKISLRLTEPNIKMILKEIQPGGKFIQEIWEIRILKNNEIQLLIGDNFHNECISVGPQVSADFLSKLKNKRILRAFKTHEEARQNHSWCKA